MRIRRTIPDHIDHCTDAQRWSWIQPSLDYCYLCHRVNVPLEKHEVYHGTVNRQKSKDYGFVVALCPRCHRRVHADAKIDRMLKSKVQRLWESNHGNSRSSFMKIFHRNYIVDGEKNVAGRLNQRNGAIINRTRSSAIRARAKRAKSRGLRGGVPSDSETESTD